MGEFKPLLLFNWNDGTTARHNGASVIHHQNTRQYTTIYYCFIIMIIQLFSPDQQANDAVDALFRSPLTEHSKQTLAKAMRDRTSEDILALVVSLHTGSSYS